MVSKLQMGSTNYNKHQNSNTVNIDSQINRSLLVQYLESITLQLPGFFGWYLNSKGYGSTIGLFMRCKDNILNTCFW